MCGMLEECLLQDMFQDTSVYDTSAVLLKDVRASFEDECVLTIGTSALVDDMVEGGNASMEDEVLWWRVEVF